MNKLDDDAIMHFSKNISQIYDILISLTERVDRIEKHLCQACNEEGNDVREKS